MTDRDDRLEAAMRALLAKLGTSDPPFDELVRDLSEKFDLTEDEIKKAWKHTNFGGAP